MNAKLKKKKSAWVAIVMGSDSDYSTMKAAGDALKQFDIPFEFAILSAHRTPHEVANFAAKASVSGVRAVIAGAGGAAHLPGMVAAYTELPVIGVPVPIGPLQGQDALHSIVQMPKGVPVATVAIGNSWNAGVLAAQILAAGGATPNWKLLDRIRAYKHEMRMQVKKKKLR